MILFWMVGLGSRKLLDRDLRLLGGMAIREILDGLGDSRGDG